LDLGAGQNPQKQICIELGIKQLLIDLGYPKSDAHNVRRRQVDILDFESVKREINSFFDDDKVDCVVSIGNIEHLNKSDGFLLLENVEKLARKLIIFETPNGFVHQGPVDGNIYQIHLSGWTPSEFKNRGYKCYGTTGLKFLKKDSEKGAYKFQIRGMRMLDVLLSRILFTKYFPKLCFNFVAFKLIDPSYNPPSWTKK